MRDRFDKFTERARRVLTLAQEESLRFNHDYIGTEHLLLGLVREGGGVATWVLANLGVDLNKVRSAVEFTIGRGDRPVAGEIGLTPRAKKVIELAVDEAGRLSHHYIGTEHLLLGLVREGKGIAADVLGSLGVRLGDARREVVRVLSQARPQRRIPPDMVVSPIFGGRGFPVGQELCVVLMSFADEARPIYDDHIRKVVVEQCGLECRRADDVFKAGQTMESVWEQMNRARVIVADVSGRNPNVFYELGIAHTLGKPVILITRSEDDVPFDLRHLRFVEYEYTPQGCQELERKLREAIQAVVGSRRE
jgi:nucleoside 2-deoxyribosyltransferase